jgi:hypothetical protein
LPPSSLIGEAVRLGPAPGESSSSKGGEQSDAHLPSGASKYRLRRDVYDCRLEYSASGNVSREVGEGKRSW